MDLDRPLDDLIPKRKNADRPAPAANKPRVSRDRREAVPYADKWVHDAFQGPNGGRRPRDVAGSGAGFVGASPRIEVSGLHYEVTVADLKGIFNQAGTLVQGPTIVYDRSGRSTGVATMEYASAQQAKIAINKFDGAKTKGETISIKLLPPVQPRAAARPEAQRQQSGSSLLARLGGGERADRGERGERGGPTRGSDAPRRGAPPSDRGRGRPAPRGGAGAARPARRGPATADDLDKELAGFMKPDAGGDVAMA